MDNPGLSPEVQEALQRRSGAPTPQLSQVSQQAPMQESVPQPMPQSEMTASSAPPSATPSKFQPQTQEDMIVAALIEHLKNGTKLKKQEMEMQSPSMGAPQGSAPLM